MSSPNGNAPASGGNGNATVGNVHKSTANRLPAKSVTPGSALKKTAPIRPPKSQQGQRGGGK